jgi:hypothetical protein
VARRDEATTTSDSADRAENEKNVLAAANEK